MKILLTLLLISGMANANEYLSYVAVDPCRIVDTREAVGTIDAGEFRNFKVTGTLGELAIQGGTTNCPNPMPGIKPQAVSAYVLVVPDKGTAGVATAYPSDKLPPPVGAGSTVNFSRGQVTGNTTNITLCEECPADGEFAVLARHTGFNLVVDVQGYFYPTPTSPDDTPSGLVDNEDGTVTDHTTGLMWEKKSPTEPNGQCEAFNCVNYIYSWSRYSIEKFSIRSPTGSAFSFLERMNNKYANNIDDTCFAGYCDWRMPTLSELQTILEETAPYLNPIFGPMPIYRGEYWTFTTAYGGPILTAGENLPWIVDFVDGTVGHPVDQNVYHFVRLVRNGK